MRRVGDFGLEGVAVADEDRAGPQVGAVALYIGLHRAESARAEAACIPGDDIQPFHEAAGLVIGRGNFLRRPVRQNLGQVRRGRAGIERHEGRRPGRYR